MPRFHPPSPAMVIALTALFVALGGTGYAATKLQDKPSASPAKKQASAAARRGPRGPRGLRGLPGTARAYAKVNADGTVNPASSKGVTTGNVTKTGPGAASYCFHGLRFTPKAIAASI